MGFDGKTLIHPSQVEPANEVWAPSAADIDYAERVIAAFDEAVADGRGVVTVDGRMIENLHVDNARRVLATAEAIAAAEILCAIRNSEESASRSARSSLRISGGSTRLGVTVQRERKRAARSSGATGLKYSPVATSAAAMNRWTPAARHGETISMWNHVSGQAPPSVGR
jgi:hypothetical protein